MEAVQFTQHQHLFVLDVDYVADLATSWIYNADKQDTRVHFAASNIFSPAFQPISVMEVVAEQQEPQLIEWEPKQHKPSEITDLRGAKRGPKGYKERQKRKLEEMEALHQQDQEEADTRMEGDEDTMQQDQPSGKRMRIESADGTPYIPVSGRIWKAQPRRAGEIMKAGSSSWDKKMNDKASRANFLAQKRAAVDAAKAKRKEIAEQRKAADERKKTNRAKSEVTQKVTSNATLKKMMKNKKQKKLLRKADTN